MLTEDQYVNLMDKLHKAMRNHHFDDLIPALVTMLVVVTSESKTDKKMIMGYLADTFDRMEKLK